MWLHLYWLLQISRDFHKIYIYIWIFFPQYKYTCIYICIHIHRTCVYISTDFCKTVEIFTKYIYIYIYFTKKMYIHIYMYIYSQKMCLCLYRLFQISRDFHEKTQIRFSFPQKNILTYIYIYIYIFIENVSISLLTFLILILILTVRLVMGPLLLVRCSLIIRRYICICTVVYMYIYDTGIYDIWKIHNLRDFDSQTGDGALATLAVLVNNPQVCMYMCLCMYQQVYVYICTCALAVCMYRCIYVYIRWGSCYSCGARW